MACGINGELWSWIKAYLSNRIRCVSANGQTWPWCMLIYVGIYIAAD